MMNEKHEVRTPNRSPLTHKRSLTYWYNLKRQKICSVNRGGQLSQLINLPSEQNYLLIRKNEDEKCIHSIYKGQHEQLEDIFKAVIRKKGCAKSGTNLFILTDWLSVLVLLEIHNPYIEGYMEFVDS